MSGYSIMEISNDSGSTHHWIVIYISDLNTFCPHGWQIWLWDNFLKSSMRIQPAGNHLKGSIICWQLNHCKTCKANKLEFQRSTIKSHFKNPTMHQTLHPTMHHVVTKMCTHVHISVTKWCTVGYRTDALWDLCKRSFVVLVEAEYSPYSELTKDTP